MSLAKKIAVAVKNALIAENFNANIYVNTERDDVWVTTHPVWSDPATRNEWDELGSIEWYRLDGYTADELAAFADDKAPEHWTAWARESIEELGKNNRVFAAPRRVEDDAHQTEETLEAELAALNERYESSLRAMGPYPNACDYSALRTMEEHAAELRDALRRIGSYGKR